MSSMVTNRKPGASSRANEWSKEGDSSNSVDILDNDGDVEGNSSSFQYSHFGLTSGEILDLLRKHGKNELPERVVPKWYIFVSLLWEPMPVMIWIAIIIEAILGKWMDTSILLAIQITNASIAFYETTKSGDAVAALKASLKPLATAKRDGEWKQIDASLLVPGDLVSLGSGSAVPADCRINDGTIELDQAALTGESMAVMKFKGDACQMGSTVVRGEVEATVEFTGAKTFFGRTASLLQVSIFSLLLNEFLIH
jgi:H+-transporting ATPase